MKISFFYLAYFYFAVTFGHGTTQTNNENAEQPTSSTTEPRKSRTGVILRLLDKDTTRVLGTLRKHCMEKTNISAESLERAYVGKFDDDMKVKCFARCGLMTLDLITPKGYVDFALLKDVMPTFLEPFLNAAQANCNFKEGPNEDETCDHGLKYAICVQQLDPEVFYLLNVGKLLDDNQTNCRFMRCFYPMKIVCEKRKNCLVQKITKLKIKRSVVLNRVQQFFSDICNGFLGSDSYGNPTLLN